MMHKIHHGQIGRKKRKFSKIHVNSNANRVTFINFAEMEGFIIFLKIGEYAI